MVVGTFDNLAGERRARIGGGVWNRVGDVCALGVGVEEMLSVFDEDEEDVLLPFRALISSLMWLAMLTGPDIAHAVRAIARYCARPKLRHWKAARDVLG